MAVSKNPSAGKNYAGPVHGGEGKEDLKTHGKYEEMGTHRSAPNPKPTVESGPKDPHRDGKEESGFDLHSKSYAGPQNMIPTSLGTRNPDDIR